MTSTATRPRWAEPTTASRAGDGPAEPADGPRTHRPQARDLGPLRGAELAQARALGRVATVGPGTVVAAAGSAVTQVQLVIDGELQLMARHEGGRATTAVVRAGGVIGDIPLLLGHAMPFDVVASRTTDMVVLTARRWRELLVASPTLSLRWMGSIARRLEDDRRRLVVMTSKPLLAQVAYLLLDLAEDDVDQAVVQLSHATIAQLLGARRQSVTRVVAELRRRGLVSTCYSRTAILDVAGLAEVVGVEPLPGVRASP